jgi:excisionase family DNA binding protein
VTSERGRLLERLGADESGVGTLFRTGEVATILRVSPRAVRAWADSGRIACERREGGHRLFPAAAVRDALRQMEEGGAGPGDGGRVEV